MVFEDAEKIAEEAKTRPKRTIIIVIIALVIIAAIAFVQGFFTEKGTQQAKPPTSARKEQSEAPATPDQQTRKEETSGTVSLEQETHGDKSPAIVTEGGDVKIVYEGEKGNQ